MDFDSYYRLCEVARMLGVTKNALLNREKRGTVTIYRPHDRLSLIDKEQAHKLIEKKKLEKEAKENGNN